MKKIYEKPQSEVVKVEVAKMIATSNPDVGFKAGETEDFGSRGSSWFEDDGEDY